MDIRVQVTPPINAVAQQFQTLQTALDILDLSPFIPLIANEVRNIFETEGYGQWPQLSPDYAAWKAANYPGQTILKLTDAYFTAATSPGNSNNHIESTANRLFYGVSGPYYAARHEFGTDVPRRPVFELLVRAEIFQQAIAEAMHNLIREQIQESGL